MPVKNYPAAVAYVVNLVVGAVVAFGFMSPATASGITAGAVALTSLAVAFLVHPFMLGVATGAFQSFLIALAGFGFHLDDQRIAGAVALFGLVATVIMHVLGTPQVAHRQGTTVAEMEKVTR
jgi:hypothetical protein